MYMKVASSSSANTSATMAILISTSLRLAILILNTVHQLGLCKKYLTPSGRVYIGLSSLKAQVSWVNRSRHLPVALVILNEAYRDHTLSMLQSLFSHTTTMVLRLNFSLTHFRNLTTSPYLLMTIIIKPACLPPYLYASA